MNLTWLHILAQMAPPAGGEGLLPVLMYVVIFVSVFLLAMVLFAQRGRAEITPEREVALATGHADRHTVFESPALQPLMWLLLVAARRLPIAGTRAKLQRTLVAAGSPNFYTPDEFLAVSMLWGIVLALLLEVTNYLVYQTASLVVLPLGFGVGTGAHVYYLSGMASKRVRVISKRIPYTLDLIALSMGAGATFTEAVRTVIREDAKHPFNVELNTVLAEGELGTTRGQALRNLSDRIPLEGLRSIVAAIIQAEGLGTPLSDVLKEQANLLRLQRSVRAEKLAAAASVHILIPSLLILISVVLAIFGPVIIRAIKGQLF